MNRKVKALFLVSMLLVLAVSGCQIAKYRADAKRAAKYREEKAARAVSTVPTTQPSETTEAPTEETRPNKAPITVDFEELRKDGPDIVAWLHLPGTMLNYPVVQAKDNEYYLYRLPNGEQSVSGTLFVDCNSKPDFSDMSTIIFGHNMKNGTMFSDLNKYGKQEFLYAYPSLYLLTPEKNFRVDIFASILTESDGDLYRMAQSEDSWYSLVETAEKESLVKGYFSPEPFTPLLMLSTCSDEFKGARFVTIGTLTEID